MASDTSLASPIGIPQYIQQGLLARFGSYPFGAFPEKTPCLRSCCTYLHCSEMKVPILATGMLHVSSTPLTRNVTLVTADRIWTTCLESVQGTHTLQKASCGDISICYIVSSLQPFMERQWDVPSTVVLTGQRAGCTGGRALCLLSFFSQHCLKPEKL